MWPVTRAAGIVATYNLLCLMTPTLSAFTAFALCRHLTGDFRASLAGGFVFGSSTYISWELLDHLWLAMVFLVPLFPYLALCFLGRETADGFARAKYVAALTALVIGQFLLSPEILATATLFGAIAIVVAMGIFDETRRAGLKKPDRSRSNLVRPCRACARALPRALLSLALRDCADLQSRALLDRSAELRVPDRPEHVLAPAADALAQPARDVGMRTQRVSRPAAFRGASFRPQPYAFAARTDAACDGAYRRGGHPGADTSFQRPGIAAAPLAFHGAGPVAQQRSPGTVHGLPVWCSP
jgi:hypothetical protein